MVGGPLVAPHSDPRGKRAIPKGSYDTSLIPMFRPEARVVTEVAMGAKIMDSVLVVMVVDCSVL